MLTAARSFFLSLCLALACFALAGPAELRAKVEKAETEAQFKALTPELDKALGDSWSAGAKFKDDVVWQDLQDTAISQLDNLVAADKAAKGDLSAPQAVAKKILSGPEYHDNGVSTGKNWLSQTFDRAGKVIGEWFNNLWKKLFGDRNIQTPSSGFGQMNFAPFVWGILILGLAGFAFYAITRFRWTSSRKVKAGGMLAEDEPDRSADEWITRSDELSANRQYREAVRCLYLASLVKFDEANVMRFRRGETNWEHLWRYDESPRKPSGLDLTEPTRAFDIIWYGHRTEGQADVDKFRAFYNQVCAATAKAKAA